MRRVAILVGLGFLVVGGADAECLGAQQAARVWISTESALLSKPSDVVVDANGRVLVLDALEARLFVLRAPGVVELQVGREGSGPGEFREPSEVTLHGEGFDVLDRGNNRIQEFDRSGTPVASRQLPPFGSMYPTATLDGLVAVNTLGDSTLIAVYDEQGSLTSRFAQPVAPMPRGISMVAVRREVLGGQVPGFFRNTVAPYFGPDGSMWLAWIADARVERWTIAGDLEASIQLDEPELETTRDAFFDRYKDPNLRGLPSLALIADIYPTAAGAWVLLNGGDDDPAVVVQLSRDGQRVRRWAFPEAKGASLLAVDETQKIVFFALRPTAQLVEFALEAGGN